MREVIFKNIFKKQYKKMLSRGKEESSLKDVIKLLALDLPLPESLKNHPLAGQFKGFRDLHIEPDWVLIYRKVNSKDKAYGKLYLELTGTHSDLFK